MRRGAETALAGKALILATAKVQLSDGQNEKYLMFTRKAIANAMRASLP